MGRSWLLAAASLVVVSCPTLGLASSAPPPGNPPLLRDASDAIPEPPAFRSAPPSAPEASVGSSTVDVLYLYPEEDSSVAEAALREEMAPQLAYWNEVLSNSRVAGTVRLVAIQPISLGKLPLAPNGQVDAQTLIYNLLADNTLRERRLALSEAYGADVVFIRVPNMDISGVAYLSTNALTSYALLGNSVGGTVQDLVAHEGGHLLGLRHCAPSAGPDGPFSPGDEAFCTVAGPTSLRTVVGYSTDCPGGCKHEVPYYSDPDTALVVDGVTISIGIPGEADGAALARERFPIVASYREPRLVLGSGRFSLKAEWHTPDGKSGVAEAVALTRDTGYFWFFNQDNVEVTVKVLDGCGLNGKFWVFASGLTNVEVTLTVTDTVTGQAKTYTNPQGKAFQPIQDTGALGC